MNRISSYVCAIILVWSSVCAAETGPYKDMIEKMSSKAGELATYADTNKLDSPTYNKWYEEFKNISDEFAKTYSSSHKKRASFQLSRQGIDELSMAWNMLRSADEADQMYVESITSSQGDAKYAHGWKNTAQTNRKNACATVTKGIKLLKDAKASVGNEASE